MRRLQFLFWNVNIRKYLYLFTNTFVHRLFSFVGSLNFEELDERLDCNSLKEDCKIDDRNGGRDEQGLLFNFFRINEEDESESDSSAQTAIRHDEFLHIVKLV